MRYPIFAIIATLLAATVITVMLVMNARGGSSTPTASAAATQAAAALSPQTPEIPPVGDKLTLTDAEWQARLTPEQYKVLRRHGTEPAFCGTYVAQKTHGEGTYSCAGCGAPLFTSDTKFESGTGWPSFFQPLPGRVGEQVDRSYGVERTEVHCARCDGHLGHSFNDGPPPTGMRFCINAVSLAFRPKPLKATFGAGCFWGVEATFRAVPGVIDARVGYAGGTTRNPTYQDICSSETGHAEVVEVDFDPTRVTYEQLLEVFWANHDPTTLNRQGPDHGTQYRSVIFAHSPEQKAAAAASVAAQEAAKRFRRPIVTAIEAAPTFYAAEEYHQRYLEKHGLVNCHVPGTSAK